jgi:hypothetical protein
VATGWGSLNADAYTTGASALGGGGSGVKRSAFITLSRVLLYICIKQLTRTPATALTTPHRGRSRWENSPSPTISDHRSWIAPVSGDLKTTANSA